MWHVAQSLQDETDDPPSTEVSSLHEAPTTSTPHHPPKRVLRIRPGLVAHRALFHQAYPKKGQWEEGPATPASASVRHAHRSLHCAKRLAFTANGDVLIGLMLKSAEHGTPSPGSSILPGVRNAQSCGVQSSGTVLAGGVAPLRHSIPTGHEDDVFVVGCTLELEHVMVSPCEPPNASCDASLGRAAVMSFWFGRKPSRSVVVPADSSVRDEEKKEDRHIFLEDVSLVRVFSFPLGAACDNGWYIVCAHPDPCVDPFDPSESSCLFDAANASDVRIIEILEERDFYASENALLPEWCMRLAADDERQQSSTSSDDSDEG